MRRINYVGGSGVRIISRADVIAAGLADPGVDLTWNKANGFELDVPDTLAAWLISVDGDLKDDDALDFGSVAGGAFRLEPSPRVAVVGTSLTAGDPFTTNYSRGGHFWTLWLDVLTHSRLTFVLNKAVGGQNTTGMLAFIPDLVASAPSIVIIEVGPNDAKGAMTAAQTIANVTTMCDAFRRSGIRSLVLLPTPSTLMDTAGEKAALFDSIVGLKAFGQARNDVDVIDTYTPVADPATMAWVTGFDLDGTHPDIRGAYAMAKPIADWFNLRFPKVTALTMSEQDVADLLPNPMMLGNAAGVATPGVSISGGVTANSKVARTDLPGEWQQVVLTSGPTNVLQDTTTGFVVGDTVYAMVEFETDEAGFAPTDFWMSITARSAAPADILSYSVGDTAVTVWPQVRSGVFRSAPFVIPALTVTMRVLVRLNGAGTFRFGRMCLRKVGT